MSTTEPGSAGARAAAALPESPDLGRALLHGVRRSAWALITAVILLLVSLPASRDLESFTRTVGILFLVLAAVIIIATVLSRRESRAN